MCLGMQPRGGLFCSQLLSIRCYVTETLPFSGFAYTVLFFIELLLGGGEKEKKKQPYFSFLFPMCLQLPLCVFIVFLQTTNLTLEAKLNWRLFLM